MNQQKAKTAVFLSTDVYERVRLIAFEQKTSQSAVIELALSKYFQNLDKKKIKKQEAA